MLALLANLPNELKETPNFYSDVFENFWKGLSTEFIDRSNSHIFLNAYAECVVYFAITLRYNYNYNNECIYMYVYIRFNTLPLFFFFTVNQMMKNLLKQLLI